MRSDDAPRTFERPAPSNAWLTGYIPDLPTPFDANGDVDLTAFAQLCERQIKAGVTALVVGETSGEASTLEPAEHDAIIRTAVETASGRARIIAGAGSNSTSQAIDQTRRAEMAGADAVLSVVPYYNKPMQSGLVAHFRAIADSTALPIILHDIPARTIRELSDDTIAGLSQSRQFVGLRDAAADPARALRLRSMVPAGFCLLSGDDTTAIAFLACGGDGCISLVSNVTPDLCRDIFSSCRQGRSQSARYLHNRIACLAAELARENPTALKYALSLLDLMRPDTRLPLTQLDGQARDRLTQILAAIADEDLDTERPRQLG